MKSGDVKMAATLFVLIGEETASEVLRYLNEAEIEAISKEISNVGPIASASFYDAQHGYAVAEGGDLLKRLILVAVIQQIGYGQAILHDIAAAVGAPDYDELLRRRIVERAQQNGVDDAEDRRIGTGAERQRDDGNEGESGLSAQPAQPITKILPQVSHNLSPARLVRTSK